MKNIILTIITGIIASQSLFGQQFKMRALYVTKDSVFEVYKHGATDEVGNDGLYQVVVDTPFVVHYFSERKNGVRNGLFFEFYIPSGMPKERGKYVDNEKDGEWFYWNEKGGLVKRESWQRGKLIKTPK